MSFNTVWQCGHCGSVYTNEFIANACCNECEELSYQCSHCKMLYSEKPKGKCLECGK